MAHKLLVVLLLLFSTYGYSGSVGDVDPDVNSPLSSDGHDCSPQNNINATKSIIQTNCPAMEFIGLETHNTRFSLTGSNSSSGKKKATQ